MSWWEDFGMIFVIFGGLLAFIIGLGIILMLATGIPSCRALENSTAKETKFTFWNGCFIKVNGEFVPRGQWINNSGN